jgi:hypothetical protein
MTVSFELPGRFVERRGFVRVDHQTKQLESAFRFGIITCDPNRRILSVVKHISPTGALIEVDNAVDIPGQFTLAIESEPSARVCRVAWKTAKQLAVNFDGSASEVTPESQEQAQSGRHDQRQAPRRNANTTGWIRLDGSFATRECKIVDISTAGVRLVIPLASRLPETFTLFFSKRAQGHQVRIIWRRDNQIGAKFI